MNDVIINKIQSLQRCIARVRAEHGLASGDFAGKITREGVIFGAGVIRRQNPHDGF